MNRLVNLKGQCKRVFVFRLFSWISFPQASEYLTRVVSNFFKNSWRYLQLKVQRCHWHRWQMEKIFNQRSFKYFVGYLWVVELTYRSIFLQVHFQVSAVWYCFHFSICHRYCWHRWCTLTCEYLHAFLKKIQNDPSVIFGGLGGDDFWKNPEAKNLVALSL